MNLRQDTTTEDWPTRPWIMAMTCALAGLLFHLLVDVDGDMPGALRQSAATFVAIAAISFVLTVEQRRWWWSLGFALGWGLVMALVGWFTAQYNHNGEIAEFPFLSGLLAVLLAAPLFQTMRDAESTERARRLPYRKLHGHAWTDAVIGAASLVFVGIAFALAWLIAGLFNLIGIDAIERLLKEEWFGWMLAGFAFGTAVGLLRERDSLVATLQKLVMVVLSVLAPVLAIALIAFLASVPFTGLDELWDSIVPATPLMLVAAAGAILLANAVIGDGEEDRPSNRALRLAAPALVLAILPLAIIAALSLGQRIGQYGWTPERIWGVIAVAVALVYGIAGWWAVAKGRNQFDDVLRPLQTKMVVGLCGLALLLALPIVDFGAISARSQLARLEGGPLKADEFDWAAMAFDFGPAGRERLARIMRSGPADQRELAKNALAADRRWSVAVDVEALRDGREAEQRLRLATPDIVMTDTLRKEIGRFSACIGKQAACVLMRIAPERYLLISTAGSNRLVSSREIDLAQVDHGAGKLATFKRPEQVDGVDLGNAAIDVRPIQRRQLHVDGKPVGEPFE